MRNVSLLGTRMIVGGYLATHGAQKLFGAFGGHGLEATGKAFESMGLKPGKAMAGLAGASELGGGIMTALGIADPLGPVAIAGTMAVATAVHRKQGPLSQNGGYELPLTNMAIVLGLLAVGPGRLRLGPALPKSLRRVVKLGAVVGTGAALAQLLGAPTPAATGTAQTDTATDASHSGGAADAQQGDRAADADAVV